MTRDKLVAYCESKKIVLEAWAPLVRGERFKHPEIVKLAEKYKKSPAQILIRYGLDRVRLSRVTRQRPLADVRLSLLQGFVVIPKSTKQERIADNANVFDFTLEKEDLDHLTTLDEFLITVSSPSARPPDLRLTLLARALRTGKLPLFLRRPQSNAMYRKSLSEAPEASTNSSSIANTNEVKEQTRTQLEPTPSSTWPT